MLLARVHGEGDSGDEVAVDDNYGGNDTVVVFSIVTPILIVLLLLGVTYVALLEVVVVFAFTI